jgi:hypothetical protein
MGFLLFSWFESDSVSSSTNGGVLIGSTVNSRQLTWLHPRNPLHSSGAPLVDNRICDGNVNRLQQS